jgi:hypothetical protein
MRSGQTTQFQGKGGTKKPLNPMWTGVGCVLMIGFLILGYLLAEWFLPANMKANWIYIPPEFAWPPFAPYFIFKIAIGIMTLMLGTLLVSILYAIVNPPKPGKYDVQHPEDMPPVYTKRK